MKPSDIDNMYLRDFIATVAEHDAGRVERKNLRIAEQAEAVRLAMGVQDPDEFVGAIRSLRGYGESRDS